MASSRTIDAPGIELREIDRSQYSTQDNSLPNAPIVLITGVASKGKNYVPQWINTKQTFIDKFGAPETEFEKYFYNGCAEVIDRGAVCIACKLPYYNAESYADDDGNCSYACCQYKVDSSLKKIDETKSAMSSTITEIKGVYDNIVKVLKKLGKYNDFAEKYQLTTVKGMRSAILELERIYGTIVADLMEDEIDPSSTASTVKELKDRLEAIASKITVDNLDLLFLDSNLTSYVQIESDDEVNNRTGRISLTDLDDLRTGVKASMLNKIKIVDISRERLTKTGFDSTSISVRIDDSSAAETIWTNEALGIFPVITTPVNAMFFQQLFNATSAAGTEMISDYNPITSLSVAPPKSNLSGLDIDLSELSNSDNYVVALSDDSSVDEETVSKIASDQFPLINFKNAEHLETEHLKKIGVVVFRAYADSANSNKVNYQLLESFVGSLDKQAKASDGSSMFIDMIVNSSSRYINVFSNVNQNLLKAASTLYIKNQRSQMLGFFDVECQKTIDVTKTILSPLTKIFKLCEDPNQVPLDLVVDAGVSNIAQYIESRGDISDEEFKWILQYNNGSVNSQTSKWQQVLKKFDDFCHYTRKDCMFIADGLRPFCLIGDQKLVRSTKTGSTVENTIVPLIRCISGINSSYSAGYCDWFQSTDAYSGDYFWCPPSIKAASIYVYCDTYFHTWDAPAGMTRGIVPNVVDVAFSPNKDDAGKIYSQCWNYAINYPLDGIIMEGQKTFQQNKTALDRVNVRRLLLKLEKQVVRAAKYFLYEGNTEYLRQKFVDTIRPYFEDAVNGDGIYEYAIKCDDEINTAQTIENHELHCKIAVKPVKTIEYIVISLICTSQSASVSEEVLK